MAKKHSTKRNAAKGTTKASRKGKPAPVTAASAKPSPFLDDPRLPAVGTTIHREYKGKTYDVTRAAESFKYEGREYRSLSAIAKEILGGASVNGFLWFGLTPRANATSETKKAEKTAKAEKRANASALPKGEKNGLATEGGQRAAVAALLGKKQPKRHRISEDAAAADAAHAAAEASQETAPTV